MLLMVKRCLLSRDSGSWNTPFSQLRPSNGHLSEYPRGRRDLAMGDYLQAFLFLESQEKVTEG